MILGEDICLTSDQIIIIAQLELSLSGNTAKVHNFSLQLLISRDFKKNALVQIRK